MHNLSGPELPSTSGVTKRLVIFLHGLGADGNDLLSLAPMLGLPDTHFMSPHAPFNCDMAPYGYQWFSLRDRNPARITEEIKIAEPMLNAYIDAALTRFRLTPQDVAIIGFSQGSMMSLHTAPRRLEPIAGVVAISGALMGGKALAREVRSRPSVCLIHGTADEVVPFMAMEDAESALEAAAIPVESHARPDLGHGIDEVGITIMAGFLKQIFAIEPRQQ